MKIAVFGGGNAGYAFGGHLTMLGHQVRLCEDPAYESTVADMEQWGGITCQGVIEGRGMPYLVTTDPAAALEGAELIIIAVPAFAQDLVFDRCMAHFQQGQTVVFFPSNYAALKSGLKMKRAGKEGLITIAEADSIPYAARKTEGGRVVISGFKDRLYLSAIPSSQNDTVLKLLNESLYPIFVDGHNAIFSSLNNTNCVLHCTTAILNAGWIERTKGDFHFYSDGMTASVCRMMEALEKEIIQVSQSFGPRICTQKEFFNEYYSIPMKDQLYEMIQLSQAHASVRAPEELDYRYLSEDVPYGLVPVEALGKLLGIHTPVTSALILMADVLNATDYRRVGMTAEKLGIAGMTPEEILSIVQ